MLGDPNTGIPSICLGGGSVLEDATGGPSATVGVCPVQLSQERNINHYALIDITGTTIQVSIYQVQKNLPTTLFCTFEMEGGNGNSNQADLSGDGKINFEDFVVVASSWLYCTDPDLVNCIQL